MTRRLPARLLLPACLFAVGCAAGPGGAYGPPPLRVVEATVLRAPESLDGDLADDDPEVRLVAVRALGRMGGDPAAERAAALLKDPDPRVQGAAAFAVGATGSDRAPALLRANLPDLDEGGTSATASAAALGLAFCRDPDAEAVLVTLGAGPHWPVEVPEALYAHYRYREGGAPESVTPSLLRYEHHPVARGRAGLGWLGRVIRDPALLDPLIRLCADRDGSVRRVAAMGLANGADDKARPAADAERAVAALLPLLDDRIPEVAVAACRGLARYDGETVDQALIRATRRKDFHTRSAAAQVLAQRKTAAAADRLLELAREDSSPSVRYEAAVALVAVAPDRAREAVPSLRSAESSYVRVAAATVLAELREDDDATRQLIDLAANDPHVRVRETALGGLEGRAGEAVEGAISAALADDDPVVVAVACDLVRKNGLAALVPGVLEVPGRFPGTVGADAREGAIGALAGIESPVHADFVRGFLEDENPSVRWAARGALLEMFPPPEGTPAPDPLDPEGRTRWAAVPEDLAAELATLTVETTLVLETSVGPLTIRLDPAQAPIHCAHVVFLARRGFYDGLTWHRVVPDFVIQGGCPRGDGSGTAGITLPLEPTALPYERGVLGMPRSSHPDSGGCQLFVMHSRAPHLDLRYTAFGRVADGHETLGRVDVDTVILRARVEGTK